MSPLNRGQNEKFPTTTPLKFKTSLPKNYPVDDFKPLKKNVFVKLNHFSKDRGENKKNETTT